MKVRIIDSAGGQTAVSVDLDGQVIGRRGGGADVELDNDGRVSRRHGRVWLQDGAVWYEDLGSANGSFLDGTPLRGRVRLEPGQAITLGGSRLVLDTDARAGELAAADVPAMEVRMEARADGLPASVPAAYVSALYEFVQALLSSTSRELMPLALRRLYEVVPAAQRISLVEWPPGDDGSFRHLASTGGSISASLARQAVERRQALLFSDGAAQEGVHVGASVFHHGIRSAVYVPLLRDGDAIAVLCVDTPTPSLPFTANDFQFVCAVGGLLTSALTAEDLREEARRRQLEAREMQARREAVLGFLKIASHDLKSPLTAIVSSVSVARTIPDRPDVVARLLEVAESAGTRAIALIRAYLEVSALESGHHLEADRVALDPRALVDEEMEILRRAELNGKTAFVNNVACASMRADRQKLGQILANLMANGAKYSPRGGTVTVDAEEGGGEVVFHVRDQGVGISEEDQRKLFDEFQRVGDRSLASGSGLGLWLTAMLVDAHGGRIWVRSEIGHGSTFSFAIPQ